MNILPFFFLLAILATYHLSYVLPVVLWLLNYTQPFALEYYKDWLANRRNK